MHAQADEAIAIEARIPQLMSEGKRAEAIALAERLTELVRAQKGDDHLDTARSLVTLASLYNIQRRLTEAEPLLKRALAIREKALGSSHPDTLAILGVLGPLYRALGRGAEAELLEKRTRQTPHRTDEHAADDVKLRNEAATHAAQGKHPEAEQTYKSAISAAEKTYGLEHPRVVHSLNPLADLYVKQGRVAEAELLLKRALAVRQKTNELADLHLQTAQAHETSAAIKLDADWVVLSACNTAAASADKLGADALSGLARAFFYAGARALLVSHWTATAASSAGATAVPVAYTRYPALVNGGIGVHPRTARAENQQRLSSECQLHRGSHRRDGCRGMVQSASETGAVESSAASDGFEAGAWRAYDQLLVAQKQLYN